MHKKLFGASYEESTKLVTQKSLKLDKDSFKYMEFRQRIPMPLIVCFFLAPLIYMVGTKMPLAITEKKNYFAFSIAKYVIDFGIIIKVVLIVWVLLSLLFLIQHQNYGIYVLVSYFTVLPMAIATELTMFNLFLGPSVAGVGIVGSFIMIVTGCSYTFIVAYNLLRRMKALMYSEKQKQVSFKSYLVITIIGLCLTVGSSFTFPAKKFNLLFYVLSFGLLLVFVMVAVVYKMMFKKFVMFYYFAKYGEQYKEKFKITDEQWHGPSKAKRLAKKKGK